MLTENEADLHVVDDAVHKFEMISGAILSRRYKCKILGLGVWKHKLNWPLDYVRVEKELKVFGILISDSYRSILKSNWDYRFAKFQSSVVSCSSRRLSSLYAKVEVLRLFSLSRVYYIALILPITKTIVKKFEQVMGKFIWNQSGWILRVSLDEVKE